MRINKPDSITDKQWLEYLEARSERFGEVEKELLSISNKVLKDVPRGKTINVYHVVEAIKKHFDE